MVEKDWKEQNAKEQNVIQRIVQSYDDFSKGQKKIADYIVNDIYKIVNVTASRLGELTGVSCSTVVRFAAQLGYDSYVELQTAIQEMMRAKLTSVQRVEMIISQIDEQDIVTAVLHSDILKIKKTLEYIDRDLFNAAVNCIADARKIYIIGTRSSAYLAGFLYFQLNMILDDVRMVHYSSASEVCEQILRVDEKCLVIAISFPRYSNMTIKALEYAKSKNAKIIAITDSYASPLYRYADYTLIAHSDIALFADSLVAPFSVINALITAVGILKKEDVYRALIRLEDIWQQYAVYGSVENES